MVTLPLYKTVCVITGVAVAVRFIHEPHIGADSHFVGSVAVIKNEPFGISLGPPEHGSAEPLLFEPLYSQVVLVINDGAP
jgi:hypothetical protein